MCAVIITPLEYFNVKQGKRVERTLTYVERYGDGEYAKAALLLDEAVDNRYSELQKILTDTNLTAPELERQYRKFIMDLLSDSGLRSAMNQLLRFHEELVQCVLNDLCDQELAKDFFLNSSGDWLRTYYPYICDKREKWKDPLAFQAIEQFYLEQQKTDMCNAPV